MLAVLYVAGSLYFLFNLRERIDELGKGQTASNAQIAELSKRMQSAEADSETLATQLGMTKKELAARSAELQREQVAQRASQQRLAEEQKQQLSQVNGEVANVKTDVGGVKTDVAATKAELAAAEAKLQSAVGDLGMQSGLIANDSRRPRGAQAQRRSQLLRIYSGQGRATSGRFDGQPATEKD